MRWPRGQAVLGFVLAATCPSVAVGDDPEEDLVKPYSAHNLSSLLQDRRPGLIAVFFGSGAAAAPRGEADAFSEFTRSAWESPEMVRFGFVDCGRWPDVCINHNIRRTPAIMLYPPDFKAPEFYIGGMKSGAISTKIADLIVGVDKTYEVSVKTVLDFLRNDFRPLKLILFTKKKAVPTGFHALSSDPALWPHVQFGFARDPVKELLQAFRVVELPALVFQHGTNFSSRQVYFGGGLDYPVVRDWLITRVRETTLEATWSMDDGGLGALDAPKEAASGGGSAPGGAPASPQGQPLYKRLGYGVAACPPGQEITSVKECERAVRSLGIPVEPRWVSVFPGLPRWCSVREEASSSGAEHMHFNSAATGQARKDLAVVCRVAAAGGKPVQGQGPKASAAAAAAFQAKQQKKQSPAAAAPAPLTVPEITGQNYEEFLSSAGFVLIFLKYGPIMHDEISMLRQLEKKFKPKLDKQRTALKWAWVDVRVETHLKGAFGTDTLPTAVIFKPHKQQPRYAPLASAHVRADVNSISRLVENMLNGDAKFKPVPARSLMTWADRGDSTPQSKKPTAAAPGNKRVAGSSDEKPRIATYEKLEAGAAGCPEGMEITSVEECEQAIKALGISADPKWTAAYPLVPRFCSVRGVAIIGEPHRMHFNTAAEGQGRKDLSPVCKADPARLTQTIPELTGKTYLDVLGQARMSLIYLREGPISPNEIEMLSSLRQEVDAQVEAGRLNWAWIDLRAERKLRKIFDTEVLPSAVVLDTSGRQPRAALLSHEEAGGEPLPADASAIAALLERVLSDEAEFTPVSRQDLMMWAIRA